MGRGKALYVSINIMKYLTDVPTVIKAKDFPVDNSIPKGKIDPIILSMKIPHFDFFQSIFLYGIHLIDNLFLSFLSYLFV